MKWFKRKKASKTKALSAGTSENLPQEDVLPEESPPGTDTVDISEAFKDTVTEEKPHGEEETVPEEAAEPVLPEAAFSDESLHEAQASEDDSEYPEETGKTETPPQKRRFFTRLKERMHKTRENLTARVDRLVLGKKTIDLDLLDELEEVLITSDLGVKTTQTLLARVTEKIRRNELKDPQKLREHLQAEIQAILNVPSPSPISRAGSPHIIMVVGVNGVGKTTTIGKLAHQFQSQGKKVMLAACDTFRAAAVEQLVQWGERANVPVIRQKSGSDPSAVAFDALDAAVSRQMDLLILDTAGRMHTKVNLMEELKKIHRTLNRKMESAPNEVWLVLDASTGQNALSQAHFFKEAIGITGLILTKLDGTAKGGIVVAICDALHIPVRYIGIGEKIDDLRPFDAEEFAKAIF